MMRATKNLALALALSLVLPAAACAAEEPEAAPEGGGTAATAGPQTDEQKTLYALGLAMAQQLGPFALTNDDLAMVQQGLTDGVLKHEPKVVLNEWGPKISGLAQARTAAAASQEKTAAADFLAKQAAMPGATRTESGIIITEITPGTGASPKATDTVSVHYHGTLRDGSVFDSSVERGTPATFPLNQVIPCWTEGLQTMKVGGKSRLVCPPELAYGDSGRPGIPPGAALVFEVELLDIVQK